MIPIFRAKHYKDDIYLIGSLIGKEDEYYIIEDKDMEYYRPIDITTLAIHFPDMLDIQGNKIFASLSEDGKGGDIFQYNNFTAYRELDNQTSTAIINQGKYVLLIGDNFYSLFANQGKVIGIQE